MLGDSSFDQCVFWSLVVLVQSVARCCILVQTLWIYSCEIPFVWSTSTLRYRFSPHCSSLVGQSSLCSSALKYLLSTCRQSFTLLSRCWSNHFSRSVSDVLTTTLDCVLEVDAFVGHIRFWLSRAAHSIAKSETFFRLILLCVCVRQILSFSLTEWNPKLFQSKSDFTSHFHSPGFSLKDYELLIKGLWYSCSAAYCVTGLGSHFTTESRI